MIEMSPLKKSKPPELVTQKWLSGNQKTQNGSKIEYQIAMKNLSVMRGPNIYLHIVSCFKVPEYYTLNFQGISVLFRNINPHTLHHAQPLYNHL